MFLDAFLSKYPYTDFHELNLDFLLKNYKFLLDSLVNIDNWIDNHEKEYEELLSYYKRLEAGDFTPEMLEEMRLWCVRNTQDIIGSAIKTVFFGITEDGYFYADIPDNWSEISFFTTEYDIVIPDTDFGHLVLQY